PSTARKRTTRRRAHALRRRYRLFLLVGRQGRLPSRALLARRGGNDLYLLLLGLLGFPVASLLTFGHLDLPGLTMHKNGICALFLATPSQNRMDGRPLGRTAGRLTGRVRAERSAPFPAPTGFCRRSISIARAGT